jgi:hypothetical protein
MSNDIEFIDGFFAKAPHQNAPEFVKAKVNIKREELLQWLSGRPDEWISVDIKEARSGKWYASVDNWQPDENHSAQNQSSPSSLSMPEEDGLDSIPFDNNSSPDFDKEDIPF